MSIKSIKVGERRDAFPDVQTFGLKERPFTSDSPISNMFLSHRNVHDFKPFESRLTPPHYNPNSSTVKLSPISRKENKPTSPRVLGEFQINELQTRVEEQKRVWLSQKSHLQKKLRVLSEQIELQRKLAKDKQVSLINQNRERRCLTQQLQREIKFLRVKLQAKTLQLNNLQEGHRPPLQPFDQFSLSRQHQQLLQQLHQELLRAEEKLIKQENAIKELRLNQSSFQRMEYRIDQLVECMSSLKSSFNSQLDQQKCIINRTLNQLEKQHFLKLKQIKQKCFGSIKFQCKDGEGYLNKIQKVESRCLERQMLGSQALRFSIR